MLVLNYLWIIPALPLAGAAINGIFGRKWPKAVATGVALTATTLAFANSGPSSAASSTACTISSGLPATMALMHGSSFRGESGVALRHLADRYDTLIRAAIG